MRRGTETAITRAPFGPQLFSACGCCGELLLNEGICAVIIDQRCGVNARP
jgi:hypothetical protein